MGRTTQSGVTTRKPLPSAHDPAANILVREQEERGGVAAVATVELAGTEVASRAVLDFESGGSVRVVAEERSATRTGPHRWVKALLVLGDVAAVWIAQIFATLVVAGHGVGPPFAPSNTS